jgi:formamidopyrimidine-DNA glycosylase
LPEMPEVETMVDRLQRYVGRDVWYVSPADGEDPTRYHNRDFTPPQKLNGIFRRGKFMVFMLDDCAMLAHNAMSGYWDDMDCPWTFDYVEGARTSSKTDVRALVEVAGPHGSTAIIQFHDARKFGYIHVVSPDELAAKLSKLGPEMLDSANLYEPSEVINEEKFVALFKGSKKAVKEILMNQDKVAGLGNIYAAEACWAAKIDPFRIANMLTNKEASQLFVSSQAVLRAALDRQLNYGELQVYRRNQCDCGSGICFEKLKGRTTYWCPACQK